MRAAVVVLVSVVSGACRLGFSEQCPAGETCDDPDGPTASRYAAAVLADAPLAYFQFNKLAGELDELAIYGSALSPAQVAAHFVAAGS